MPRCKKDASLSPASDVERNFWETAGSYPNCPLIVKVQKEHSIILTNLIKAAAQPTSVTS